MHAAMTVYQENLQWAKHLFLSVVGIQAADAHIKIGLGEVFHAEPDASAHPTNGRRSQPDDTLDIIRSVFVPQGQGPAPFVAAEFEAALAMDPTPWVLANADGTGLTAEFPFSGGRPAVDQSMTGRGGAPETALFTATAETRHPQLGSGALLRLALPVVLDPHQAADLAMRLNRLQVTEYADAPFLGAWCPDHHTNGVSFVTFLPSATHRPGLLKVMAFNAALHTNWARETLQRSKVFPRD